MNVISRKTINEFGKKYSDAKKSLLSWYHEACTADWKTPQDIKERYSSASFLSSNLVIFNIKGNKYRLVAKIAYKTQAVFIKWIGTHSEYDKKKF
ncbi:MAG: type II toxin-antitoxin system HigB family toxin [Deltaproteobacteria bacterium]|nr:type II toxin-antitoxin system HigB family toxin [Deltaproteobacteria bacterium]MBW2011239.1 type II toxin-antitoxin system HigB family toxin [Deltaproteobacteria bacterium]MBW2099596.1 type II toxin-antitoxin system HigB family toxin [Deltaproteobacteria bacterium]